MNATQFSQAMEIAQSPDFRYTDDEGREIIDTKAFLGCGLPGFEPIFCTLEQVAAFIKYQAMQLNGQWNSEELQNIAAIGRKKFIIIGRGGPNTTTVEDDMAWWNTQSGNHPRCGYSPEGEFRSHPRAGRWYADIAMGDISNNTHVTMTGTGDTFTEAIKDLRARVNAWLNKNVYKIGDLV